MRFVELPLSGAFIVEIEERRDDRGFFARSFCGDEFGRHGLATHFPQCNISFNEHKATLRGMHYQADPRPEVKLVRCTRGAIYDVIVDLRPASETFLQWRGVELTAENRRALYIPAGLAHGFQTTTDGAEVFYMMGDVYVPELARGVRWDDPQFGIIWPLPSPRLSERDASYPDFRP